jgi:Kef-type K+ transport system membrane component KefB
MSTTEIFLIAMILILGVPFLIWRLFRTEYYAPLVVVQIITGILMGPGVLGAVVPAYHRFVFSPQVTQTLNGIGWWAVMIFVWVAGVELDLGRAWKQRRETGVTAALAFATPMLLGSVVGLALVSQPGGWIGSAARPWQFVLGVGMSCAVTALPILILFMEKMDILRQPLGKRILRYASVDDIAIWSVLGLILMDWSRLSRQLLFLAGFSLISFAFRRLMPRLLPSDRWYTSLLWLAVVAFAADWCGMHFMVGAFLAGVVMDADWFEQSEMDALRRFVLLTGMPVFFLSTGLRTQWGVGGAQVFVAAAALLAAAVFGKLLGVQVAGKLLGWAPGEASLIGWLLQTKALIMIIFANVLLDRKVITSDTFTALLLMAVCSTMLTIPVVLPKLQRAQQRAEEETEDQGEAVRAPDVVF